MLAGLDDFVEVLLKLAHLVGDEAERVMNSEVLGVGEIFVEIPALSVQLGKHCFNFDLHKFLCFPSIVRVTSMWIDWLRCGFMAMVLAMVLAMVMRGRELCEVRFNARNRN